MKLFYIDSLTYFIIETVPASFIAFYLTDKEKELIEMLLKNNHDS